jgi:hypothetical protein
MKENRMIDIMEAARMLGRELCGKVAHVTGTSVRRKSLGLPSLAAYVLYIDLDCDALPDIQQVIAEILQETGGRSHFHGHELHLHIGGTPQFAVRP